VKEKLLYIQIIVLLNINIKISEEQKLCLKINYSLIELLVNS